MNCGNFPETGILCSWIMCIYASPCSPRTCRMIFSRSQNFQQPRAYLPGAGLTVSVRPVPASSRLRQIAKYIPSLFSINMDLDSIHRTIRVTTLTGKRNFGRAEVTAALSHSQSELVANLDIAKNTLRAITYVCGCIRDCHGEKRGHHDGRPTYPGDMP